MKHFLLCSILALWAANAFSQSSVTGAVKDSKDGSPVAFATAALLRPDSSAITGVMTGDDGRFIIENVAAGNYLLQVSFIGYEKSYRSVNVPAQSDVGEIMLSEDANVLGEVVVTGRRALIDQRLDRIVVNVTGNMITSGLNINDVLKRLPGLVVDSDGSVKLNGRAATIYIDGRPTNLPSEQVAQLLSGMMGDMIDRVELIDNPSSRYEAGMSAAIVNIRMKRDASLGLNGTVQAGAGFTESDFASTGGLNLNFRSKKVNIFGNAGYDRKPNEAELFQIRNYGGETPLTYDQYAQSHNDIPAYAIRAGIDWYAGPKHTFGFLFNSLSSELKLDRTGQSSVSRQGVSKTDSIIFSDIRQRSPYRTQMYNLNYRFDGEKSGTLTVDLDYGLANRKNRQNLKSSYQNPDGSELRPQTEIHDNGSNNIKIYSFKLDYTKPLSDNSGLEAGLKAGQTETDNEIVYENLIDGAWMNDPNQSNRFKYTEQISAAYLTLNHRFGKFSAMAGLRAEYTSMKGESPTMDTTFTRSYVDWFPSAYMQYQIAEKQSLNLSYSRKINRPGFNLLNPFRSYIDPFTYTSGNPDLQPEYINTTALRYSIGNYSFNLSYSARNNIFELDFIQDDESHTMAYIQRNTGKRKQLSLGINAPFQVAKWYSLSLYAEPGFMIVDTRNSGERFRKNYFSAYAGLFHNLTFSPTFRATVQMSWIKPTYYGIIKVEDIWYMNAQIEKTFFDQRLGLSLSANDIFSTMWNTVGSMKIANINQSVRENTNLRQVLLTLRYSFGSQQIRGARSRSVGIEEEMGRAR
ncbi:MAG: TonB-dependent receptor [Tannerella sp.]|nr:TonB-dependent receptor [Tannerella sp.]